MSTVTDPIADFLARVRNGTRAQKAEVFLPYSKIKAEIARILKDEGYISDYSIDTSAAHPRIKIVNKIVNRSSAIQACDGLAGRDCAATSVRMRSREFLVGWVWRFSLHRVAFCRGAKRRSKRSVANCWPTFGKFLCHELEIKMLRFPTRSKSTSTVRVRFPWKARR